MTISNSLSSISFAFPWSFSPTRPFLLNVLLIHPGKHLKSHSDSMFLLMSSYFLAMQFQSKPNLSLTHNLSLALMHWTNLSLFKGCFPSWCLLDKLEAESFSSSNFLCHLQNPLFSTLKFSWCGCFKKSLTLRNCPSQCVLQQWHLSLIECYFRDFWFDFCFILSNLWWCSFMKK